jgi:hypothetical protein
MIGYHASHEQFAPSELTEYVKAAAAAGFSAVRMPRPRRQRRSSSINRSASFRGRSSGWEKVQAAGLDLSAKRALVEPRVGAPRLRRPWELRGINRSSGYAKEQPAAESEEHWARRQRLDALYTAPPFYGSPEMTAVLRREGLAVNRKRVCQLRRLRGLQSLAPRLETRHAHPVYPYLLQDTGVERSNQG